MVTYKSTPDELASVRVNFPSNSGRVLVNVTLSLTISSEIPFAVNLNFIFSPGFVFLPANLDMASKQLAVVCVLIHSSLQSDAEMAFATPKAKVFFFIRVNVSSRMARSRNDEPKVIPSFLYSAGSSFVMSTNCSATSGLETRT